MNHVKIIKISNDLQPLRLSSNELVALIIKISDLFVEEKKFHLSVEFSGESITYNCIEDIDESDFSDDIKSLTLNLSDKDYSKYLDINIRESFGTITLKGDSAWVNHTRKEALSALEPFTPMYPFLNQIYIRFISAIIIGQIFSHFIFSQPLPDSFDSLSASKYVILFGLFSAWIYSDILKKIFPYIGITDSSSKWSRRKKFLVQASLFIGFAASVIALYQFFY